MCENAGQDQDEIATQTEKGHKFIEGAGSHDRLTEPI